MRFCKPLIASAIALLLAACQPPPRGQPLRGDEIQPGDVEVAGLLYCESARLELAAVVLGGPPKAASLEDVRDATVPGCTWVAADGPQRVRLNVHDGETPGAMTPARKFDALAAAHAHAMGQGTAIEDFGVRAARFGFATPEGEGLLLVQTPTRVLEFQGKSVPAAKLAIFARGVVDNLEKPT